MEWHYNEATGEYTVMRGACRATVWHTVAGTWAALIAGVHREEGRDQVPTLEAAQAWAVTHLADLTTKGHCGA